MTHDPITDSSNNHDTWDDDERDDLDDLIAEIAKEHPEFPAMVEAAVQRRREARARGEDPNDLPPTEEAGEETKDEPTIPHTTR